MENENLDAITRSFSAFSGQPPTVVERVQAHASSRIIARLSTDSDSAIIGSYEPNWREAEAFIYLARHFRGHGLRVPEILAFDEKTQTILMEDLGKDTLFDYLTKTRAAGTEFPRLVEEAYQRALNDLVQFQHEGGPLVDFTRCFPSYGFTAHDMREDCRLFVHAVIHATGISGDSCRLEEELSELVTALSAQEPATTFMYRDFQARNIVMQGGTLGYIDFQGGRLGNPAYDVASLLYQARAGLPQTVRMRLLTAYCEAARPYATFEEQFFVDHFDGWVLIRLLQALGRAGELGLQGGNPLFRSGLPLGVAALRDFLTTANLPMQKSALTEYVDGLFELFCSAN